MIDADDWNELFEKPTPKPPPPPKPLTKREREVLTLMVRGLSYKLIGAELGVSEHAAKFHSTNVYRKLGVTTRTGAAVKAVREGLA